ncbi:HDOD domain-containing protein [bacterium]|nr:HDOD domain-containing protein [bacterium]
MPGPLDDYFSKHEYLPYQPRLRRRLLTVIEASASQDVRRAAIEEVAHIQPVFAFNLFKFVNSQAFNLQTKIIRIKQAATLPALEALGKMIEATPEYPPELERLFSLERFEEHGRVTALAVLILSQLSKRFGTVQRECLYTAAMLHDIGRLFLVSSDPAGYARLLNESAALDPEKRAPVLEAEMKYFGTDHATLGVAALERIGIVDKDICAAVREHHSVPPAGGPVLLAYADRVVKRFGMGPSFGGASFDDAEDARIKIGVEESLHLTIGEALMHILTDIDNLRAGGMINFKNLAGDVV